MKQNIVINGTMAGIAVIGFYLLFYFFKTDALFNIGVYISSLLIYAFFMYRAARNTDTQDFKMLLRAAFSVFLIANVFYYVFDFILYKKIDLSLAEQQKELAITLFQKNTPIEQQPTMLKNIEEADIHTPYYLLKLWTRGAIGGFGLAVLMAYLVKRQF
jgi:Protein of unknown function (DUF4199)